MRRCLSWILVLGSVCSCSAQFLSSAPGSTSFEDSAALDGLLHAHRAELLFRQDDVVSVQVYGVKDYDIEQRVAEDGTVDFPLVGKLQVAGLTVQQLELMLEHALASGGMIKNPQVTVHAVSRPSAIVTVSGDVGKPGIFPAYGDLTLIDYLSEAGGLNENMSGLNSPASSVVTLIRPSLDRAVMIPVGPDAAKSPYARIPIFPGDEVRVARLGVVYAFGAFRNQGVVPLKASSPTTVLQVVALAGGIGYEADRKDASIIRIRGNSRYVLGIDVSKILKGKMADVALQSDDILFVPTNSMKAAIKGGGSGVLVSLAAAYLYSHP